MDKYKDIINIPYKKVKCTFDFLKSTLFLCIILSFKFATNVKRLIYIRKYLSENIYFFFQFNVFNIHNPHKRGLAWRL